MSSVVAQRTARGRRSAASARGGSRARAVALGTSGLLAVIALWWLAVALAGTRNPMVAQFAPQRTLAALPALVAQDQLVMHVATSVRRVAVGLAWALVVGVPAGFAIGRLRWLEQMLSPAIQFLRMVSPLSWMPIAVMSLGVGDRAVYFLLAFSAVWPLLMNTAAGVAQLDRRWIELGDSLAATRIEMIWHIYVPGIAAHVLTGVRLAIGVLWIVLVPAEMLGVSAGLGYLILDTRDRLAYSELTAVILVIGALGFALDLAARALAARFHRGASQRN